MRLRFSIRDLLWLTLVVGILLAWWFAKPPSQVGRFQFINRTDGSTQMLDTTTGRLWQHYRSRDGWTLDANPPADAK